MAIITKPAWVTSHFYHKDGRAQHTVLNANGEQRPTQLNDARELGLLPSVSKYLGVLAKPGLEKWKLQRAVLAAEKNPRQKGESDSYYCKRMVDVAFQEVDDAAQLGTAIHHEIDRILRLPPGEEVKVNRFQLGDMVHDLSPYVGPILKWIKAKGIRIEKPEAIVVNNAHGYGGTTDAPYTSPKAFGILDYKSRKTEPGEAIEPWPEQVLQIAAYHVAYWGEESLLRSNAWGINAYISTTEPGRVEIAMYSPMCLRAAWSEFAKLCSIWRYFNEYDPRLPANQQVAWPKPVMSVVSRPGEFNVMETMSPPDRTPKPPQEKTMLELVVGAASITGECDGIQFLDPITCAKFTPGRVSTDYAWWYHAETNTAKVGLRSDAAMLEHGWRNAFLAYPKNLEDEDKVKKSPPPPPPPSPEPAPTPAPTDRLAQLETMAMGFGKFRAKKLKEVPSTYLDWLRDQVEKKDNKIPDHVKEYLARPDVNRAIDQDLEREDRK